MQPCRFCPTPATHEFDTHGYCCVHFSELVEHGATLKIVVFGPRPLAAQNQEEALQRGLKLAHALETPPSAGSVTRESK